MIRNHLLAMLLSFPAVCVSQVLISPSAPKEQESVRVQVAVGVIGQHPFSNMFDTYNPRATVVSMVNNKITITLEMMNSDFLAGPSRELDQPVGQFPPGDYQVEVIRRLPNGTSAGPVGSATFSVRARAGSEPLWNHTDLWWNPQESGWGLNIMQHGSGIIFATWFVYGPDGKPIWYSVPEGSWFSPSEYRGPVYRTTGPAFDGPFDPATVTRTLVGSVVFGFDRYSANSMTAFFTIDGRTTFKQLQRQGF